jgi:hypothetical protein
MKRSENSIDSLSGEKDSISTGAKISEIKINRVDKYKAKPRLENAGRNHDARSPTAGEMSVLMSLSNWQVLPNGL